MRSVNRQHANPLKAFIAILTVSAIASAPVAHSHTYPLSKPAVISETDLRVIAQFLGINFERFQVEIGQDFCVRVWIEVTEKGKTDDLGPNGGHCTLAGSHILIVAWQWENDSVVVRTAVHDSHGRGGWLGAEPVDVPSSGNSSRDVWGPSGSAPTLAQGERTLVADFKYGGRRDDAVRFRVFAELLPNPSGATSSGGLPQTEKQHSIGRAT
jgi:hypothetical protein